jgi:hypothetical protein
MNVDTLKSNPDANKSNENIQKLQELIKGQEYRRFQKEI